MSRRKQLDDEQVLVDVGRRIGEMREAQGLTQQQVVEDRTGQKHTELHCVVRQLLSGANFVTPVE